MPDRQPFDKTYLQKRIITEFPLARHIGIVVERADDDGIVLCAALEPNANYKRTAFGGSLFSVAVLGGWAWVTRYLAETNVDADAVIQESRIRYLLPVRQMLRATVSPPPAAHREKFAQMLRRAGRGRIRVQVDMLEGAAPAVAFDGVFAASLRQIAKGI
ncbi:MAG: thioesterase domain-containing protein [Pseudomonadota bacterium]|nr:thioesterase domain-containing protein [Pseudomonadota bacterium]